MRQLGKKAFVKSGKKVTNEAAPVLTLTSLYNGFKLNHKAMDLLGLEPGMTVVLFDDFIDGDPVPQEERYFIAAGFTNADGDTEGAKISDTRQFNYSHIYGTMLLDDNTVMGVDFNTLAERGLATDTGSSKVATKTMTAELVAAQDEPMEVIEGVEPMMLYKLVNFNFKDHEPKTLGKRGGEAEVETGEVE